MAPFCAIELQNSTTTRIQNARLASPSRTEAPWAAGGASPGAAGRSRTNATTPGRPTTSTIRPSTANAVRQPAASMSAWAIGGSTIDPNAPPDSITDSATPRRDSNQLETARV